LTILLPSLRCWRFRDRGSYRGLRCGDDLLKDIPLQFALFRRQPFEGASAHAQELSVRRGRGGSRRDGVVIRRQRRCDLSLSQSRTVPRLPRKSQSRAFEKNRKNGAAEVSANQGCAITKWASARNPSEEPDISDFEILCALRVNTKTRFAGKTAPYYR